MSIGARRPVGAAGDDDVARLRLCGLRNGRARGVGRGVSRRCGDDSAVHEVKSVSRGFSRIHTDLKIEIKKIRADPCESAATVLPTLPRSVALPFGGRTVALLGQMTVGADARLGVDAPEQAVIRRRHRGVVVHGDELLLPAQRRAESLASGIEAFLIEPHGHATPPGRPAAALRMARFTAALVSVILYLLRLSGLAWATAAFAAAIAVSLLMGLPTSAAAASSEIQGMGATCPSTTRALLTVLPSISSATLAIARGQSNAARWRTS